MWRSFNLRLNEVKKSHAASSKRMLMKPTILFGAALITLLVPRSEAQTKIATNLYLFGNTAALIGPDSVLLVDSGTNADIINYELQTISDAPVRLVINTSASILHSGGNENFAKLGAIILARPQVRERIAHPIFSANGMAGSGTPPQRTESALPTLTYDSPVTLHLNGEEIQLIPIPHAYSDGDTIVHFVKADVLMTGEIFQPSSYPNIDRANGGTVQGLLNSLNLVASLAGPNTKIIPGYPKTDRAAVIAQRDMILVLRDRVAAMVKQGASEGEVLDAKVNADYPSNRLGSNRIIRSIYEELTSTK